MTIPSPMKLPWFHILLALSQGSLHGYGIQRSVLERTEGKLRLWPASLYRLLGNLEEDGLIEPAEAPAEDTEDLRRQYYRLTDRGHERLRAEATMMGEWARLAQREAPGWEGV